MSKDMAELTSRLAITAIEQNELYQAAKRDTEEAEAYAAELEAKLRQEVKDKERVERVWGDNYTALRARLEAVEKERDDARKLQAKDFELLDSPWKQRAERAEAALATARRDALDEAAAKFEAEDHHWGPAIGTALRALAAQEGQG